MIERLQAFGEAHHALITRSQAIALGCTSDEIRSFRRMGLLERPARGVYRFAGSVPTWRQQLLVAVYAAGEGAVASGCGEQGWIADRRSQARAYPCRCSL